MEAAPSSPLPASHLKGGVGGREEGFLSTQGPEHSEAAGRTGPEDVQKYLGSGIHA